MTLSARLRAAYDRCKLFPEAGRNADGTFTVKGDAWLAVLELRELVPDIDTALQRAEIAEGQLGPLLRQATEDDVAAAIAGSYVEELGQIEPAKLLEFWNRMLDRFIGARGEDD